MPKAGYEVATLKAEVAELLKSKAKAAGVGLNAFLESLSLVQNRDNPGRQLGRTIRTSSGFLSSPATDDALLGKFETFV